MSTEIRKNECRYALLSTNFILSKPWNAKKERILFTIFVFTEIPEDAVAESRDTEANVMRFCVRFFHCKCLAKILALSCNLSIERVPWNLTLISAHDGYELRIDRLTNTQLDLQLD